MACAVPLSTRLGPRQWPGVDAAVSVAVLAGIAVSAHPHRPGGGVHTLALVLLAPPASLPLAVRRRWPVPVFFIVLVTGVAVQADRTWSLTALAAAEAGVGLNLAFAPTGKGSVMFDAFTALVQLTVWIAADGIRRRRAYAAILRERSRPSCS